MGTLYVVATPLGNLEDFSPRAVRTLRAADVVYAEDTRRSRILLDHYGVDRPLRSLHEHNERERIGEVLALLAAGQAVALLTDAGTPAVSDPGAAVVRAAARAGATVSPIPGPSALTAALSACGFEAGAAGVLFVGFLPARGAARRDASERAAAHPGVIVLFEAPHRIAATLADLAGAAPEREACVTRELTKMHEEVRRGSLRELAAWAQGEVKGELTIVIGPSAEPAAVAVDAGEIDRALERCLAAGLSARDAATSVAAILELPRREVYRRSLELRSR